MGLYSKTLYYNVALFWEGVEAFTTVINDVNAKYNDAFWRRFAFWGRRMRTPEWKINVRDTEINVAAAVLSANGQKPLRGAGAWQTYGGTIPLIGHGFQMDASDFMALKAFEPIADDPNFHARYDYLERFAAAVGGMHSRINMMVFEGLSTGFITADAQNNGEGIQIAVDLNYPSDRFKVPSYGIWGSGSDDPIQDLLDIQDWMDDNSLPYTNWLISKKLIRKMSVNKNVRIKIAMKMYPNTPNPGQIPLTRKEVMEGLVNYYGIVPIIEIDEKSNVERDGKGNVIKSFAEDVAVLCVPDRFFELQNCENIYEMDNNPNVLHSSVEEGRISVIVEYFSNPVKDVTSMEAYVLPVPRNPNNICILKTSTDQPWGGGKTTKTTKAVKAAAKPVATTIAVGDGEYDRAAVISAMETIGVKINANTGVAKTQEAVNLLGEEKIKALENVLNGNAPANKEEANQ